jgi:hypothetical protein
MIDPVADAKAAWDGMERPTASKVAAALTQGGRKIAPSTVAAWKDAGWPPSPDAAAGDASADAADLAPLPDMAGLDDAELVRHACREGLDAARHIFRLVKHDPAMVKMSPDDVGALVRATGELIGKAMLGLRAGEAGAADAEAGPRPSRENPLTPPFAAWEAALAEAAARRRSESA